MLERILISKEITVIKLVTVISLYIIIYCIITRGVDIHMNNCEEYYKKIANAKHHDLVEQIHLIKANVRNIIELGCGSGRDTVYLLQERF